MSDVFYRFRSTQKLLNDPYQELEKQEIYFSSPEELNDPMEGFRDIFWAGDGVLWENLVKHYILCLEHCCMISIFPGEMYKISKTDIPITKTRDDFPTPEYANLYGQICNELSCDKIVLQFLSGLIKRKNPIRRDELIVHLWSIHLTIISKILKLYENSKLIPQRSTKLEIPEVPLHPEVFDLINKGEEEHPEGIDFIKLIFLALSRIQSDVELFLQINYRDDPNRHNKLFILSQFPRTYVHAIENLIYPEWYTACFMADCSNSTVWGHYGDNHKGICLIFKSTNEKEHNIIHLFGINGESGSGPMSGWIPLNFYEVAYENKFVEVDFFKSLGRLSMPKIEKFWYRTEDGTKSNYVDGVFSDQIAWRKEYWNRFYRGVTTKLKDWSYEKEYRLILEGGMIDIFDQERRKLKYNFSDLTGVIFGIKTSLDDKLRIIQTIKEKCIKEKRTDFKFYQALYNPHNGTIDHYELTMFKISE